jgi:SAM-dependent methyltransferase
MPLTDHRTAVDSVRQILHCLACLACPHCQTNLVWFKSLLRCPSCDTAYPLIHEIPDLRLSTHQEKDETAAWAKHWSEGHQQSLSQRFFSFYRQAVFARTVRYFLDRYFPAHGIFIEAGSGTSETSMRINKRGGARTLVAIDIVLPVLEKCHTIMDVRVCGDIFSLPFLADSIDGIWNVGVMEHFTQAQIDRIMREFRRVLKPGSPIILLWPGADSIPQKLLRIAEKMINLSRKEEKFRFHPEEISQLRSVRHGEAILRANGFQTWHIDYGLLSLMAFKTLIGKKPEI